jgi:Site-specific recombinases, DNA invertase Pin homologs
LTKQYNAGLYLRLSVDDAVNPQKKGKGNPFQNESASIENQRILLTEYVDINGWNATQTYIDDGYSGGSFDNRPAFQQMIRDAKAGLIDLILVKDLSRFGRDYIETGRYTDEVFPSLGVRFIALMDNIDSEGNADLLPFRSILNDYHLKDLSRKVKSAMKTKAAIGEYIGTWAPYGFMKDPAYKNRLLIDDYAADVVRRIFDMRSQDMGYAKIAAALNDDAILSPGTYRNVKAGIEKAPKSWIYTAVKLILNNEAYIGHSVRFKTGHLSYKGRIQVKKPKEDWIRCENVFPPIVSLEMWEAVRQFDNKRKGYDRAKAKPSLFRGLLRCADCGSSMAVKKSSFTNRTTGEKKTSNFYSCLKHDSSGGSVCSRHYTPEKALMEIIRNDMQNRIEALDIDESRIVQDIQKSFHLGSLEQATKYRDALAVKLNELSLAGKKLYEDRLKGIISIDTFMALSEESEAERLLVKTEHERLSELLAREEHRVLDTECIVPKLREFLSLEEPSNETLSELIDKVYVGEGEGSGRTKIHDVRIVYQFETTK